MDAQVDPPVNTLFRTLYAQYNTPKYALLEALEPPRHGLPTPMAIVHRYGFPKNGNSETAKLTVSDDPVIYCPKRLKQRFRGSSGDRGIGVAGSWLQEAPPRDPGIRGFGPFGGS